MDACTSLRESWSGNSRPPLSSLSIMIIIKPGLCPGPHWESLQRSPRPSSCVWGGRFAAGKGREGKGGKGRERRWKGKEGREGKGREGKGKDGREWKWTLATLRTDRRHDPWSTFLTFAWIRCILPLCSDYWNSHGVFWWKLREVLRHRQQIRSRSLVRPK